MNKALDAVRAGVLGRPDLVGSAVGPALCDAYDQWLRTLMPERDGIALAAVGGLGRREQAPFSDLDLVLLHRAKPADVQSVADAIWYPIWDSGLPLDHSVRTVEQAVAVARTDLKAQLGLLDIRHVAGDATLTGDLRERVYALWRRAEPDRLREFAELTRERWRSCGEVAFLLEPDLKDSRGGLRDWQALHALRAAQLIDVDAATADASIVLQDARTELQRVTGRATDVLRAQEQRPVADRLGLMSDVAGELPDDVLLRRVNEAGRTVSRALDLAWRRVLTPPRRTGLFRRSVDTSTRTPLAQDVVRQNDEVVLARDADPWSDPALALRAARVAAEQGLPLSPFTVERLASESALLPEPWPDAVRAELVGLLGAGHGAVPVLESLDAVGLLTRWIPEWQTVRFRPQRNAVHRWTVDRHLLETAAEAAGATREVARPDLLLIGALLHDIGKGDPREDHSVVGARIARPIATRMGLPPADARRVEALVRHHLLLPDTALRRDPDDPMTLSIVVEALDGSGELLDQLHALTIADAHATGPAAWSDWKAALIRDLVERVHRVLSGCEPTEIETLDPERRLLAEGGRLAVRIEGDRVLVALPDGPGILSRTAGVLALNSLDVRSAAVATHLGMAVNAFTVTPRFGDRVDPDRVHADLSRAAAGTLSLPDRLAAKERAYRRPPAGSSAPPRVLWFDDEATDATVLEVRAADGFGLLHRLTAALEQCELDVRSARLSTLGAAVVDAFYVTARGGGPVPPERRARVEAEVLAAATPVAETAGAVTSSF